MARYSRSTVDDEPSSISGSVVAEYLESRGRPRMAEHVRWMASRERDAARREQQLRDDYAALLERLHKYEPPPPRTLPPDFTPPAEASD